MNKLKSFHLLNSPHYANAFALNFHAKQMLWRLFRPPCCREKDGHSFQTNKIFNALRFRQKRETKTQQIKYYWGRYVILIKMHENKETFGKHVSSCRLSLLSLPYYEMFNNFCVVDWFSEFRQSSSRSHTIFQHFSSETISTNEQNEETMLSENLLFVALHISNTVRFKPIGHSSRWD